MYVTKCNMSSVQFIKCYQIVSAIPVWFGTDVIHTFPENQSSGLPLILNSELPPTLSITSGPVDACHDRLSHIM